MHLSNDALHRILSVPMVDTAGVTSYQLQDLWISPVAMVTEGLTTLQASQLLSDGVFWRLEPIVFCDQSMKNLGDSIEYPEGFYGLKSAVSQYTGQYELNCRTGLLGNGSVNNGFGAAELVKDATSNFYSRTIADLKIGEQKGFLPYVYKPLKVSKVAFSKLTNWKHGFSVTRTVEYTNQNSCNAPDFSDPANDSIDYLEQDYFKKFYDALTLSPIGLDEYQGSIDEKQFSFCPSLIGSDLTSGVLQTLADPYTATIAYTPIEFRTLTQPFPVATDEQKNYVSQQIAQLYAFNTSPGAEATTVQVQYLRDLASNYCLQFDWEIQRRGFDQVALRQAKLVDFNAVPIAPLELGKDYATLTTTPDMGLQCYGDLPAIAWAPDPADESKVFALCRYRPTIRPPLPDWSWEDIGLPSYLSDAITIDGTTLDKKVVQAPERKPFIYWFELKKHLTDPAYYTSLIASAGSQLFGWDFYTDFPPDIEVSRKIISPLNDWFIHFGAFVDPTKFDPLGFNNQSATNSDPSCWFIPAFSKKLCLLLAPRYIGVGSSFGKENPDDPIDPLKLQAGAWLAKTGDGETFEYAIHKTGTTDESILADLEGFKTWADEFFLSESSYTEIGRYRWLDENGTPMVDEPFYGHAEIFNLFNIDIRLTPAPA